MSHDKHLRCSFCGKSKDSVRKFISGPSVYICNECIALCNEILAEDEEREVAEAITQVPAPSLKRPSTTPTPNSASAPDVSVIGSGWTAILAVKGQPSSLPRRYGSYGQPGQSDAEPSTLGAIIQQLPTVSGSWGTGRLLSTRLLSVLITNDGRVFAGAVAPSALYAAAASHK